MNIAIRSWVLTLLSPVVTRIAGLFQSPAERIDIAIRQGYEICHAHYPPAIMTTVDEVNWECPKCGNKRRAGGLTFGTLPIRR